MGCYANGYDFRLEQSAMGPSLGLSFVAVFFHLSCGGMTRCFCMALVATTSNILALIKAPRMPR